MNIGVLTQFFPPEVGATQSRLIYYCRFLAKRGHRVHVATSFPSYPFGRVQPGYRNRFFMTEVMDGLQLLRSWSYTNPNRSMVRRVLSYGSFNLFASVMSLPRLANIDALVVECPSMMNAMAGLFWARLRRIPVVLHVSDLEIQAIIEFGMIPRFAERMARGYEKYILNASAAVAATTNLAKEYLIEAGAEAGKVAVAPNGVDCRLFRPNPARDELRRRLGLPTDAWIAIYAGTHGHMHAIDQIVKAADVLRYERGFLFIFVGDGVAKPGAIRLTEHLGLASVRFVPSQPLADLPDWLNAANVGLSTLVDTPLSATTIPVKSFSYMGCALPAIASDVGEGAKLMRAANAAICVPPEDHRGLADAVRKLRSDSQYAAELGSNGRRYALRYCDRSISARHLELMIEAAVGGRGGRVAEIPRPLADINEES